MPFTFETWKAQVSQRLGEVKTWMGQRSSENAPLLAYSTLGMLCLAPLANALANPNMTTMIEAATVLSGLGSNLLAGELQKWKDAPEAKRDEALRDGLAASLLAQTEASQQLRNDIDQVLQKLDALSETRKHLPPAEQPNFAAQWQREAERIGSQVLIQGDWVMGDKVLGDKIEQQIIYQNFTTPDPALKHAETRRAYLRWLANEVNRVPLHEVDPQQNNPKADAIRLELCDVYIGLDTTRAGSALAAVLRQTKTVLTGEPGSGKSTFVHHLIYSLAMHQLAPDPAQLQAFYAVWQEEAECKRLPVRVILRDFDAWLRSPAQPAPQAANPKCLLDFIAKVLGDNGQSKAYEMLENALKQGAVLLVLDGLDEVTQFSQRKLIRDIITKFADAFYIPPKFDDKTKKSIPAPNNRYVLTCRTRSYEEPMRGGEDVRVPQFAQYELAAFDEAKIKAFVNAWYAELFKAGRFSNASSANVKRDKLLPQLQKAEFRRMAGNPLQLTLMAWVHTEEELPERRAELYDRAIDLLLWHRESKKEGLKRLKDLLEGLDDAKRRVRVVLTEAAYLAHAQISSRDQENNREKLADVSESGLVAALAQLRNDAYGKPDKAWAQQVVDAICDRSGLLAWRVENSLTFPHRTFQEYLAACHLIKLKEFVDEAVRLAADANGLSVWREVILLAVGKDAYVDNQSIGLRPEKLASKLHKQAQDQTDDAFSVALSTLSMDVLCEVGMPSQAAEQDLNPDMLKQMRGYLQTYLTGHSHSAKHRAAIGRILAKLGDPRREVTTVEAMRWVRIPRGIFIRGSDTHASDEKPQMRVNVDYDYYLSQYPVTQAQYGQFVAARGYADERWWGEAKTAGYWQTDKGFKGRYDDWRIAPHNYGEPFLLPNHPVVGVSWYEAVAFTRWLNARVQANEVALHDQTGKPLGGKFEIRLPSETEWEKAARGTKDARAYGWGDQPDPDKANYRDAGIGSTSAVGCFTNTHGHEFGVEDMSGNVWEWCITPWQSSYKTYDDTKNIKNNSPNILRGGSSFSDYNDLRVSFRLNHGPDLRGNGVGFRLLALPIS